MPKEDAKSSERPPSLRRIAEACGVSYQSVSRILNGDTERHHEKTVDTVLTTARSMGYRRNLLARGMLTGRSTTIGVILPFSIDYEMNARLIIGIQQVLANSGYMAVTCSAEGNPDDLTKVYELIERRVEGVIFRAHPQGVTDRMIEELHHHNVPVVSVVDNDPMLDGKIDFIGSDEVEIGQLAAERLWGFGHRNFALTRVGNQRYDSMLQLRYRAFIERLESYKKDYTLVQTPTSSSPEPDRKAIHKMLSSKPTPTAVLASVDDVAYVVYGVCAELGLSVPDQVSILGSGNFRVSANIEPSLDSFDQNPEEIGREAASRILERVTSRNQSLSPVTKLIAPTLVTRASCGRAVQPPVLA